MPNAASLANLTGGSRKGRPNKSTASMKAAIQAVYDKLQEGHGEPHGHFVDWAKDNSTEFYKLASKLLPIQVSGDDENPIQHVMRVELVAPNGSGRATS